MNETLRAPLPPYVMREVQGLIELPRLLLRFPSLARQPRGDGEPVLVCIAVSRFDSSTSFWSDAIRSLTFSSNFLFSSGHTTSLPCLSLSGSKVALVRRIILKNS